MRKPLFLAALVLVFAAPVAGANAACTPSWKLVGTDTFRLHDALVRSQGVTSDGHSWTFSWQGGLERTLDNFTPVGLGTIPPPPAGAPGTPPPQLAVAPSVDANGGNRLGDNHIGDIDYANGLIYAPVEDGGE